MFKADLHCHTTFSDGTLTPQELMQLAKNVGLSALSITDHDTLGAYAQAPQEAKKLGLILGTGVELSCQFKDASIHILGYDYSLESEELRTFCEKHHRRRELRNQKILEKLSRLGMQITQDELVSTFGIDSTIGRPHIAKLMTEKGYVISPKEAFNLYIGDDKCCFDSGVAFSVEETIQVIHQADGKAFLAHPHLLSNFKSLKTLLDQAFDGIECHYARCSPEQEKRWLKIAKHRGWLMSGGSDFHGDSKAYVRLGCSWVSEEVFHQIFQKHVFL